MKTTESLQYGVNKNEKILWVGKPELMPCVFESIIYGSFFFLIGIMGIKDKTEWVKIAGVGSILFGLLISLLQFLSRAKTVYVITDKRIISNVFLGIGIKRFITHNEVSKIKVGQNGVNMLFKTKCIGFFIGEQVTEGDVYREWNYIKSTEIERATTILKKIPNITMIIEDDQTSIS